MDPHSRTIGGLPMVWTEVGLLKGRGVKRDTRRVATRGVLVPPPIGMELLLVVLSVLLTMVGPWMDGSLLQC